MNAEGLRREAERYQEMADGYAAERPAPVCPYHPWNFRDATGRDANLHGCCQDRARQAQEYRRAAKLKEIK